MSSLHPEAAALNESLQQSNPAVERLLSKRGKGAYFPAKGILSQTEAAKDKRINATIGTALEDDGTPLRLDCLQQLVNIEPEAFLYAPSCGLPELRDRWQAMMRDKNPSLAGTAVSRPVVTQALTHALTLCGQLFLDEGEPLILPDLFWGNYRLIFTNGCGAELQTYPTFVDGAFNVDGLRAALGAGAPSKRVLLFNFPNNPSGYTVTEAEADALLAILTEAAEAGNELVVLIDDAYFGLVYEDGVMAESFFGRAAQAHENILAVKIDGATKEDYVWGFRVGFITYGIRGGDADLYSVLESKTAGAVRGSISNAPRLSQALLLKAFDALGYAEQKQHKYNTLKTRYDRVRQIFAEHPEYAEQFVPVPFNSGYFMCVDLVKTEPDDVRQVLLDEFDTGLVAAAGLMRIAFSSAPLNLLDELFANLYQACKQVAGD